MESERLMSTQDPMGIAPVMSVAQQKRILHIIWLGMISALVCYWVINLRIAATPKTGAWPATLPPALIVASLVVPAVGWGFHRRTMQAVAAQIAPAVFQRLAPAERLSLQHRVQASAILSLISLETVAICGLVNSFAASPYPHLFEWLAGASLAGLVVFRLQEYPEIFSVLDKLEVRVMGSGEPWRPR